MALERNGATCSCYESERTKQMIVTCLLLLIVRAHNFFVFVLQEKGRQETEKPVFLTYEIEEKLFLLEMKRKT